MTTIVKKLNFRKWGSTEQIECMVELEIDDEGLAYFLGEKALRNRSRKSKIQGRLVTCSVRPTTAQLEKGA